jgi:short-subunit dehydrogenase
MDRTIAVFGAGTGLGAATARRFGREGYRVALVARRPEPLEKLVAELAAERIEARAFPADLADPVVVPAVVDAIEGWCGPIGVVEYAPIPAHAPFLPAVDLTAAAVGELAGLYLQTPVELARRVLPGMIERGEGAFLLAEGQSAVAPMPGMSGVGAVMAATRHWLHSLHGELAPIGVYAGLLTVSAWIDGSAGYRAVGSTLPGPVVGAAELADVYWRMVTERDTVEIAYP